MKLGSSGTLGRAWNVQRSRVVFTVLTLILFAVWYWRYGGPWQLEVEAPTKQPPIATANSFDQEIVIPKIPGGARAMGPLNENRVPDQRLTSSWTPIENGNDSWQLLGNASKVRLWRKVERTGWFQYIPPAHTMDENRNKPILYEMLSDSFKCAEGVAVKLNLTVHYEDGTEQLYFPWGYAGLSGIWVPVKPDTTLRREMDFVCAVKLTPQSPLKPEP
ncbi:MAG TPA: hypothetical protein VIY68_18675 [Steroidobacteraceae bacterium]